MQKINEPRILAPQENLLIEPDMELVDILAKSYRQESKVKRETIVERGDLAQKNLWMSQVRSCPREIHYNFFAPHRARDYTVKGLILFADGKMHHVDVQRRLEEQRKSRNPEGFLEDPKTGATGYYDDLIPVETLNGWLICDILEFKGKLPYVTEVEQADYDQAQYYILAAAFSRRLKTKRIQVRGARLLYKDRAVMNDETYLGWYVKPDIDRQKEIRNWYMWLKKIVIEQKILVRQPYTRDSIKCQYCRYHEWCWRGFPEIKVIDELVPDKRIEVPEEELVKSAVKRFMELREQSKEVTEEIEKVYKLIEGYFKATAIPRLSASDTKDLKYSPSHYKVYNKTYLRRVLGKKYFLIVEPKAGLIGEALKKGDIDGATIEKATSVKTGKWSIKVVNKEKIKEKSKKKEVKSGKTNKRSSRRTGKKNLR